MQGDSYGYRFLLLGAILAVNGFFAAAETALLSSRRSRLQARAEEGDSGAKAALVLLENPERLLSAIQVGVSVCGLVLGWAGEGTIHEMLLGWLHPFLTPATEKLLDGASFVIAFAVMTYFHVVLGEVLPKNMAIESADRLASQLAPVVLVFDRIARPLVTLIEKSSARISRLLGIKGEGGHGGGLSAEELKMVIRTSRTEGHLRLFEEDAIRRLLELQEYSAREIMVPRNQMASVSVNSSLDHVLLLLNEYQYSRLPVYEGSPDHIVGVVHLKDLVKVWMRRRAALEARRPVRPFQLAKVMRQPLFVPESKSLRELVDEFRDHHTHMGVVVDEHGTVSGLVTLEDVLEQVFGEIEDEHDISRPKISASAEVFEVDGTINIPDLANQYGVDLPSQAGFETLAGYVLFQLGHIPQVGEVVTEGNYKFTIMEMQRNRIATVKIEKLPPPKADSNS